MKKILASYFSFSAKERLIAIIILVAAFAIFLAPFFVNEKKITPKPITQKIEFSSDSIENNITHIKQNKSYNDEFEEKRFKELNPFTFNPNTLTAEGFAQLGLPAKTVKTILNYRNKGGHFYKPDDFRKIWGLTPEQANILVPYIDIPNTNHFKNAYSTNSNTNYNNANTPLIIDINTATAYDFKKLTALGNLAYKVVNYRDKLGGFLNIEQVKETYGITDSIYQAIKPFLQLKTQEINKLNINTASDFELSKHPYIPSNVAKAIVLYRNQKGVYKSVEDIKKIVFLKEPLYSKIAPYLTAD